MTVPSPRSTPLRVIALHSELADRYPTITEAAVQTFGFSLGRAVLK